jgi:hypothetical protein
MQTKLLIEYASRTLVSHPEFCYLQTGSRHVWTFVGNHLTSLRSIRTNIEGGVTQSRRSTMLIIYMQIPSKKVPQARNFVVTEQQVSSPMMQMTLQIVLTT